MSKKTIVEKKGMTIRFKNSGARIIMPKKLGSQFLKLIKSKKYNLVIEMIDIYNNSIKTNF
jgi:hypothetical protein